MKTALDEVLRLPKPYGGFAQICNVNGHAYKLVGRSASGKTGYYQLWLPKDEEVARLWATLNNQTLPQFVEAYRPIRFDLVAVDIETLILTSWSIHETCKVVAQAFKGKQDGKSVTTVSSYLKLGNGKRVRISDHASFERRSQSDFDFVFSFSRGRFYLEMNGDQVLVITNEAKASDIQFIINQAIIETLDCELNWYTAKSIYEQLNQTEQ